MLPVFVYNLQMLSYKCIKIAPRPAFKPLLEKPTVASKFTEIRNIEGDNVQLGT